MKISQCGFQGHICLQHEYTNFTGTNQNSRYLERPLTCAKDISLSSRLLLLYSWRNTIIAVLLIAMPVKRGLVAPQNIFIQTIIKKFDGSRKSFDLSLVL